MTPVRWMILVAATLAIGAMCACSSSSSSCTLPPGPVPVASIQAPCGLTFVYEGEAAGGLDAGDRYGARRQGAAAAAAAARAHRAYRQRGGDENHPAHWGHGLEDATRSRPALGRRSAARASQTSSTASRPRT